MGTTKVFFWTMTDEVVTKTYLWCEHDGSYDSYISDELSVYCPGGSPVTESDVMEMIYDDLDNGFKLFAVGAKTEIHEELQQKGRNR